MPRAVEQTIAFYGCRRAARLAHTVCGAAPWLLATPHRVMAAAKPLTVTFYDAGILTSVFAIRALVRIRALVFQSPLAQFSHIGSRSNGSWCAAGSRMIVA